jgi:putative solute:sodium symporter small subunit
MRDVSEASWWRGTRLLAAAFLLGIAVVCLLPAAFPGLFAGRTIGGLPSGVFFATIATPFIIVAACFSFAARQRALDRRFDVSDE